MYYNFAAQSFLSKQLCSRLHSTEVDFYSKKRKSLLFEPPFGRLRGNVCTSSIARWKAHVRLPIRHNWTFFTSSYCWDVTGGNQLTWAIFEGGGSLRLVEGDVAYQPLLVGRKLEGFPFHMVQKHRQKVLWISHKARVWQTDGPTDGRTDRITTPKTALA